ncbi:MAG TPA: 1-deoxy-D-xylulose-5-phosphate synthase [Desulfobacterales bacterium]|nr:1-deoxy-D-xylulose-5-phosphate synthase [Desulfobacterales bacterium]
MNRFHGIGCFDISSGTALKGQEPCPPSYTEVFGDTIVELGTKDERIFAITAAMPEGTGLIKFAEKFPARFFDVGIAEQHAVTFAAGLAVEGFRPVVAIYSTFLQRAYDQVIHDVCLPNLPVLFAIDRGGIVGEDGPTHHGHFDLTYLRALPNMTLMAPKDENELRHMLYTAFRREGPVAIRYPRGHGRGVKLDREFKKIPIGEMEVIKEGRDLVILAVGSMVWPSVDAAEELAKEGLEVSVINCRFIKPLDPRIVDLAKRVGRILVVEENVRYGGLGAGILELLNDSGVYSIKLRRMGLPDKFLEHGPVSLLREKCGLDKKGIVREAKALLEDG